MKHLPVDCPLGGDTMPRRISVYRFIDFLLTCDHPDRASGTLVVIRPENQLRGHLPRYSMAILMPPMSGNILQAITLLFQTMSNVLLKYRQEDCQM